MTTTLPEVLKPSPDEVYESLLRSLRRRKGFGLVFVNCTPIRGNLLIDEILRDLPQKRLGVMELTEPVDTLRDLVAQRSDISELNILVIKGLEKSLESDIKPGYGGKGDYYNLNSIPPILSHLNQQRENFRDRFGHLCFVFLLPPYAVKYMASRAPDFFDWGTGVFKLPTDEDIVAQESNRLLGDYGKYLTWTQAERNRRILQIQTWLSECLGNLNRQAILLCEQGKLFAASEQFEEAIASYDEAIQYNADYYDAWYNRGLSLAKLGRYAEASTSYDIALEINADDNAAWRTLKNIQKYAEKSNSDDDFEWYSRGVSLANLGRYQEAITAYDKAIQLNPNKHEVWKNRGHVLANLGRYQEAIEFYDKALNIAPNYVDAWYYRGLALASLNCYEEAIESYEKALLSQDKKSVWYSHGLALSNLGRNEEARKSFNKALMKTI